MIAASFGLPRGCAGQIPFNNADSDHSTAAEGIAVGDTAAGDKPADTAVDRTAAAHNSSDPESDCRTDRIAAANTARVRAAEPNTNNPDRNNRTRKDLRSNRRTNTGKRTHTKGQSRNTSSCRRDNTVHRNTRHRAAR